MPEEGSAVAEAVETGDPGFAGYLERWLATRPSPRMADLTGAAGGPAGVGVFCTDMIEGFVRIGNLASPRIAGIIPALVAMFGRAHEAGVRTFILTQDSHPADSPQFEQYGPHCITGTPEAETIRELRELPFADEFLIIPKETLNPALFSKLTPWLELYGVPSVAIVCGNCTDLCVYQLGMALRTWAVGRGQRVRVVAPINCIETYDLPTEVAVRRSLTPHPADFLHRVFLYHLALNGVEVVAGLR